MDIFKFKDYRDIVTQGLKTKSSKGQIGKLAEAIPMHRTQLSQVLSGSKEFSLEQAHATTIYLELAPIETKYFILLVEKERAGTQALKKYFDGDIEKLKQDSMQLSHRLKDHRNLSEADKAIFYSSWMYAAISLHCSIGKGAKLEEIAAYFSIDRKKCFEMMEFMVSSGLCILKGDRYQMGTQHTHVPAKSPLAIKHHLNWRLKSLQRQETVKDHELVFTAPMVISKKDFLVIREKLASTVKDCIEIAKESPSEELTLLTIDWLEI
jgi:hypothetical protein